MFERLLPRQTRDVCAQEAVDALVEVDATPRRRKCSRSFTRLRFALYSALLPLVEAEFVAEGFVAKCGERE